MSSIANSYPGFQSLPKGVKQMLMVSESMFFEDARTPQDLESAEHQHAVHQPKAHGPAQLVRIGATARAVH